MPKKTMAACVIEEQSVSTWSLGGGGLPVWVEEKERVYEAGVGNVRLVSVCGGPVRCMRR